MYVLLDSLSVNLQANLELLQECLQVDCFERFAHIDLLQRYCYYSVWHNKTEPFAQVKVSHYGHRILVLLGEA